MLFRFFVALPLVMVLVAGAVFADGAGWSWYKGQIHSHSTNSDGKLPPAEAAAWYKDRGYNFVAITDHHHMTDVRPLKSMQTSKFILITGEELSAEPMGKAVHTNGLNISRQIAPVEGATPTATLQMMVNAIRKEGGIAQINHPNWLWALTVDDIKPVRGALLLEVYNESETCNNEGDAAAGKPSTEQMWDALLTSGKTIYATATDDVHVYTVGHPDGPGKGWIVVRAPSLTVDNIVRGLEKGDFYASTGVELIDLLRTREKISLKIKPKPGVSYQTEFIEQGGKALPAISGTEVSYRPDPSSSYTRARVKASDGSLCLIQPVFLR